MIGERRWHAWESVEIHRQLDSFSTVAITAPFEHDRAEFREAFRPFSFTPAMVTAGGEVLFMGTVVDVNPALDPSKRTVQATAYSRPAVLADVNPPSSAYPLELNGLKLKRIAETLVAPFGLEVVMDADEGAPFRRVAIKPDQIVHSFLVELAQQRGLVISDTNFGALRFLKSDNGGAPVAQLKEGEPPLSAVNPTFSPRSYFSEITGLAKTRAGRGGSGHTEVNRHLTGVVRPHTFTLGDTDDADVPTATKAKLGRMFGNMLAIGVDLPTWRDPSGKLWAPNTSLTLEAPGAMIYGPTRFLVRGVTLRQEAHSQSTTLDLVLPGAFSGEVPEELPWD